MKIATTLVLPAGGLAQGAKPAPTPLEVAVNKTIVIGAFTGDDVANDGVGVAFVGAGVEAVQHQTK
jgi:hypothetical protein